MQDRLQEILERERLTPARFAQLVGVQRSSVSHILSGRNKPSLEFLRKTMAALDHISPDWLISGVGPYKRSEIAEMGGNKAKLEPSQSIEGTIKFPSLANSKNRSEPDKQLGVNDSEAAKEVSKTVDNNTDSDKEIVAEAEKAISSDSGSSSSIDRKKVVKTILFYDDQTFEVFYPF